MRIISQWSCRKKTHNGSRVELPIGAELPGRQETKGDVRAASVWTPEDCRLVPFRVPWPQAEAPDPLAFVWSQLEETEFRDSGEVGWEEERLGKRRQSLAAPAPQGISNGSTRCREVQLPKRWSGSEHWVGRDGKEVERWQPRAAHALIGNRKRAQFLV